MHELVTNLVHNALNYTPAGGRVTVSVDAPQGRARLRVVDNGPGIPAAERERVFECFYRLADAGTPGSGLGLAIVREICARHGAQVALDQPADGGTGLVAEVRW